MGSDSSATKAVEAMELRLDESLRCVWSNADRAEPLGLSASSPIGKYLPELLVSSEAPMIIETLRGVVENWVGAVIVACFDHEDTSRWLELKVRRVDPGETDGAALEIEVREVADRIGDENLHRESLATGNPINEFATWVAGSADLDRPCEPISDPEPVAEEKHFRALADNMRDSICEIDGSGRILYVSPSYVALLGGSADLLVGSDLLGSVHPEDRRRVSQIFRPGARSRRQGTLVYRAQNCDGVGLYLEATAREFIGPDGGLRVVVATRDVTEREHSRHALERHIELEIRVAELSRFFIDVEIDAIHAGIESRLAGIAELADAQHCWMYSFSTKKDDLEFFDWWLEEDPTRKPRPASGSVATFPYSTGLIRQGRVYQVTDVDALPKEASSERHDMLERGVRSILGIPIMSSGRFVGFLGFETFEREINWPEETIMLLRMVGEIFFSALHRRQAVVDLRRSQSQLLQSQKMEAVGTLAGGIAHDFNNHLAVMLGNARFVRQEVNAEPDVMAAIEDFERSADHCAQLTNSLLMFARQSPVEIVPVEVAELVEGVEGLVRPLLPSTILFETHLMPDLGSFAVDRVQIQQVLVNLLVNARDAMPDGGLIRLDASRRSVLQAEAKAEGLDEAREYVVLSVEDAGHGMDADTQSRVFEPFFTTKEIGEGTGLGLAMAYGIVRQSDGAIAVESRPGEGSTFQVYLPGVEARGHALPK
jgi:PAS domain S-box-containing protein